jgi:DNA modification methylase
VSVRILTGDVREMLATLPADSVDCVVTSPPYWGLRDYGVEGQLGLEPTLGEHIATMVEVFDAVRRVMKPSATLWLNYGDCYATKPNGRSAADTKAAGSDDRTFRDKPFDTTGAIYKPGYEKTARAGASENYGNLGAQHGGRVVGHGPVLKPKDLCLIPERLAIALQEDGWWVRAKNVWGKPNPIPDSSGKYRPSVSHEMVWMLAKSATCFYDAGAVAQPTSGDAHARTTKVAGCPTGDQPHTPVAHNAAEARKRRKAETVASARPPGSRPHTGLTAADEKRRLGRGYRMDDALSEDPAERMTRYLRQYEDAPALSVWRVATAGYSEAHFATFPPELAELCILAGCPAGGVVLDPFGGSGTVGLVADALGRDAILIELNPDYAALAARRLKAGFVRVEGGDSRRGLDPLPLESV